MPISHLYLTAGVSLVVSLGGTPGLAQPLPDGQPADTVPLNQDSPEPDPPSVPESDPSLQGPQLEPSQPNLQPDLFERPTQPEELNIETTQSLTLREAIELAEQNNRPLQIARLQVEVLKTIQREAKSTLLPRLIVGANLTYENQPEVEFLQGQLDNALQELRGLIDGRIESLVPPEFRPLTEREITLLNNFTDQAVANIANSTGLRGLGSSDILPLSATAAVVYSPDIWGARAAAVEAAALQVQEGELEVQRQSRDLRLLVSFAYYDLQEADALVRISQVALENALAVLRDAQALQAGGVGSQLDVRRSQVLVANIQQQLETALTLQRNSRLRLAQRLGILETVNVTAADPVEVAGTWSLSLEESIVEAFENRSDLDQLLLLTEASQRQERVERSAARPQLNVFASYSVLNVLNSPSNPGFVDGYAVGGTLLWELYDGGATNARLTREQLNQEILANQFAQTRSEIRLQVEESYNDLQANAANIQTAAETLSEAEEVLRQSRLGFQAGVVTQLEVTTAQTNLTQAETNLIRSILDYNRALAILQRPVSPAVLP